MKALLVLAKIDGWLAKVYGAREPKAPPMVACSGLDQRLDVVIDELRGLREATERLVELQAENLRLKVAGPSVSNTMDQLPPLGSIFQGLDDLVPTEPGADAEVEAIAQGFDAAADAFDSELAVKLTDAVEHGDQAELRESMAGRIGKAIKRKVKG
jgi:hypothetical protein